MDQPHSEAGALPERYALGKLAPEVREEFEEHLLECPLCLEAVEASEKLLAGLRAAVAEEVPPARASPARPRPRRRALIWAAAATCCLAAALLWNSDRAGAARARQALDEAQRSSTRLAQALEQAQQQAQSEREARQALEGKVADLSRPEAGLPVFALNLQRSAGLAEVVRLPPKQGWFVLTVDREDPPRFEAYRATLVDAAGKELWQMAPIRASSRDQLAVAFHGSLAPPGEYALRVEGLSAGGEVALVGRYPFRVAADRPR